jgi:TRAP-type C4-dicarboxylate transport system permease small subunit
VDVTTVSRGIDRISKAAGHSAGISLVIMMLLITVGVIFRYVLNDPLDFIEEISGYLQLFCVFMGLGYAFANGYHIRTFVLLNKFSPKYQRILNVAQVIVALPWAIIVGVAGVALMKDYVEMGSVSDTNLRTPLWIPTAFIIIGSIILLLNMVNWGLRHLLTKRKEDHTIE